MAVQKFLADDPENAKAIAEPYGGTALVYLCLSKYLRLQNQLSDNFLGAASALLEAGADANAGFLTKGEFPEFESALYGAAGVAHHAKLTKLLLTYGADPNDGEVVYHSAETHDPELLKVLVESGKLTKESLSLMLIRKHDWHDTAGVKYLLEHGADPNLSWGKGVYAIHHALSRSNALHAIRLLLEYGADTSVSSAGQNAVVHAAREGRSDVLALFREKGINTETEGVDKLIAACAAGDQHAVEVIITSFPEYLEEIKTIGGELLSRFTLNGNAPGVKQLLDIGIDENTPYLHGDGYFDIPQGSLAIHVAAWLGRPYMVKLLIEHGAHIDIPDGNGQTPLALAVRACINSYWTERRSPDSVAALIKAGASVKNIIFPTGYDEVDELLKKEGLNEL
ncbi:ankyrin repeat domain-containing protein [Flavitalea sp.]|nr:ankyrin repeat domain-containing protein [Flavitalea sp.]